MSATASSRKWLVAVPFVGLVLIAVALSAFDADVLYRVQERSLFLNTPLFFQQCMVSSGGLLSWAGVYLTQYFMYPVLGAVLLCLCWAVLVVVTLVAFRIPARWAAVALVPVVLLLISDVSLGYWIYYLKLRGYYFVATLGAIVVVSLVGCYRWLSARYVHLSLAFLILTAVCGYPLFGFYGLLALLLMAVSSWRTAKSRRAAIVTTLIAIPAIAAIPLFCYYLVYHETNMVNIYWTALPVFQMNDKGYPVFYIPYVLLVLVLVTMALARWPEKAGYKPVLLTVVLVLATCIFWYKDGNFRRELRMSRALDRQDWEQVIKLSADVNHPTRDICMMRNLALFRLGRQGSEMYHYPNGNSPSSSPFPTRLLHIDGKKLYLNYGLLNFCYRWCIEDGVEYGWSVEGVKMMVKCALLNGEQEAVRKYISILRKTTFQRKWCEKYEAFLRNPRLMTNDPELRPILYMLKNDDDYLTSDNADCEQFMINHFASAESQNPIYQEQSLLAALQLRNMQVFWLQFYQYTELHPEQRAPLHYQEAACLFGRLSDEVDTSRMPFDPQVVKRCDEFLAAMEQHHGQVNESVASALYDRFHDTYFYHYFFN